MVVGDAEAGGFAGGGDVRPGKLGCDPVFGSFSLGGVVGGEREVVGGWSAGHGGGLGICDDPLALNYLEEMSGCIPLVPVLALFLGGGKSLRTTRGRLLESSGKIHPSLNILNEW